MNAILEFDFNWENKPWASDKATVPVIRTGSQEHQLAEQMLAVLHREMIPAAPQVKAAIFYKLQGHYHQPNMPDKLAREVANDYARLLDGYPISVMESACDEFLLNPDQRFFPKVGELKKAMDWILYKKKRQQEKLTILIGAAE